MVLVSGGAMRWMLVCVAGVILGLAAGCNETEKSRPSTTQPISLRSQGLRQVPEYLKGTIYECANLQDTNPLVVSGYGLVVGLRGTGDNSAVPRTVREYMVKEMHRHGFSSPSAGLENVTPETVLRDPRTAVVEVNGLMPPGARKDSRFDILVSALNESYTKSLSHGNLYITDLRIMGANPSNPGGSVNNYARASGPVFVNPAYALTSGKALDATAQASLRYGRVMDGGVCLIDNPLVLRARDPQFSTTRAIERRVNERFQGVADKTNSLGVPAVAAAQNESIVCLYVPRLYGGDWQHFAGVVKHLYLNSNPAYLAQMAQKLADAAEQPGAPLENISYALEGIGPPAESVLTRMMHHKSPEIAFAAARRCGICQRGYRGAAQCADGDSPDA